MKLSPLSMPVILQAAAKIDTEGIPKDRIWSEYYVVINDKEYPFKYLVYLALELAGVTDVKFESNDGYRGYLQNQLGLPIVHHKGGYNFFTSDELAYFSSIIGKPYRKNEIAHRTYPNRLNALIAKVNYWANSILMEDYKLKRDTNWLTGFTSNIKPYIWPRIYKEKDRDIFFNVEVNGRDQFIGYKLDGYYETTKQLKPEQVKILDEFKTEIDWQWIKINYNDIQNYNWPRLIQESREYVKQYDHHHDLLKKRLYKQNLMVYMSWNINRWQKPSGGVGKTGDGFGYDEWLLNGDQVLQQNYKYGALSIFNEDPEKYADKVFDISLITKEPNDESVYWLATLRNVETISNSEANTVVEIYDQNGWLKEMNLDLEQVGIAPQSFKDEVKFNPTIFANLKFNANQLNQLPLQLILLENSVLNSVASGVISQNISKELDKIEVESKTPFSFANSGSTEADLKKTSRRIGFIVERELELKHNELQKKLLQHLQKEYSKPRVKRECKAFGGCRIDIVRETDTGYIFYEIKTYNNLLTSIRLGIGQLLEYNLFPKNQQAERMVLVSHLPASEEILEYIRHLQSFITLKFTYMHFDLEKECIVSEI